MARTLVIPEADFSVNALDTVIIERPIPCTGISLNESSLSIDYGSTGLLTATKTPSDTTDPVVWSSSDTNIATVSNGTVTGVGVGNATITAQCGSYSATCTVAVSLEWTNIAGERLAGATTYSGSGGVGYLDTGSTYGSKVSSVGTLKIRGVTGDTSSYYPYKIPDGMKRIKITRTTTNISVARIQYYSTTVADTTYGKYAQLVNHDTSVIFTDNVVIVTIPQYDGFPTIDGVGISLDLSSGTFTDNDFNNISIEFLPAAE